MADFSSICAALVAYLELLLLVNRVADGLHPVPIEPPQALLPPLGDPIPIEPPQAVLPPLIDPIPIEPPLPVLPPWRDGEVAVTFLCMQLALAPFVQSVSRANRLPMWLTILHFMLSSATVYCTTVEFICALKKVELADKLLLKSYVPIIVACVVLVFRVFEKKFRALRAAAKAAAAQSAAAQNNDSYVWTHNRW